MKRVIFSLIFIALIATACQSTPSISAITPPYINTGVDAEAWATVPAGEFPSGAESHITMIDYDYQIMVTDVTVAQYANFLNEVIASGEAGVGEFEVEVANGEVIWQEEGVAGYYPGDPFQEAKHEEEIKAGDHLFVSFVDGLRITRDGDTFTAILEYANHPMTMVSWFGANAYCEYYGYRLPLELEWEKGARGTEVIGTDADGYPFPWGYEIHGNNANYYSSFDVLEKMFGKLGNTTPVGFYNGKTYKVNGNSYETLDSASPYGLYDMAGNVWQWMGDDHPDQHYRMMRGGSFYSYEVDLRTWKENSSGPIYYAPDVGFRCVRDN
ncbi:MAG: formylglycine-generating enzyme family protein [Chloroflexota bacterium]|nr:formylglycine-generating enzyme family protein [Chloroflexota bacterium]